MPQPAARFTQAECKRAIAAAQAAGLTIAGVRVDDRGFTVLTQPDAPVAGNFEAERAEMAARLAKMAADDENDARR